jgi:antitoxin component of MazEF toxin-antitoxin module
MARKVFRTGNSTVVSLPPDALEYLGISDGAEVSVELDRENRRILITPLENPLAAMGVDEQFNQQLQAFIDLYRPALEELAR